MKTLYLIGGTMGVGKTVTCQKLKKTLNNCVYLDGDWCWDAHPFVVNDETKRMVEKNIAFLLNSFLACTAYDNVVFSWVMHQQCIIDDLLSRLDIRNVRVVAVSLVCNAETLEKRLRCDVDKGIRTSDVVERSLARISMYDKLNTIKVDTSDITVGEAAEAVAKL